MARPWTKEEENIIMDYHDEMSIEALSDFMYEQTGIIRSTSSIYSKRVAMGISANAPFGSYGYIAINTQLSIDDIRGVASRLGVKPVRENGVPRFSIKDTERIMDSINEYRSKYEMLCDIQSEVGRYLKYNPRIKPMIMRHPLYPGRSSILKKDAAYIRAQFKSQLSLEESGAWVRTSTISGNPGSIWSVIKKIGLEVRRPNEIMPNLTYIKAVDAAKVEKFLAANKRRREASGKC